MLPPSACCSRSRNKVPRWSPNNKVLNCRSTAQAKRGRSSYGVVGCCTMPSARRVEPAVRPASPGPALHRQVQAALTHAGLHTPLVRVRVRVRVRARITVRVRVRVGVRVSCAHTPRPPPPHPLSPPAHLPLSHRPSHHQQVSEPPPPSTADLLLSSLTSSVLRVLRPYT